MRSTDQSSTCAGRQKCSVNTVTGYPIQTIHLLQSPPQPSQWPQDMGPEVARLVQSDETKVVVLDDDPTGTQTVHGIPVLTQWTVEALSAELQRPDRAFFILTNSRSMSVGDACRIGREIGWNLKMAVARTGLPSS